MIFRLKISTVLIGTLCSFFSFAQDDYNPEFLIPYNDHGKWGFSDTLGNMKVDPQFEWVSFFGDMHGLMAAYVSKDGRRDYYVLGKGMCSPNEHEAHPSLFDPFLEENNLSIVLKDEKMGLFDYQKQKLIVPSEYEDYIFDTDNQAIYLTKRDPGNKENMIILSYNLKTGVSQRLKYTKVGIQPVRENDETKELILFRGNGGKWFMRVGDKWVKSEYPLVNSKKKGFDDPRIKTAGFGPTEKPAYEKVHKYRVVSFEGATLHSSIKLGENQNFQVMHKPSGFGLIKNKSEVLPFEFDFIDINYYDGFFYLLKDKKMGVLIPFTAYSAIEPKYDLISFDQKLKIRDNWQFVLFTAKVGENEGFVGENGVEYFNFY